MIVKSLTNVFWKFAAVFGGVDKRGVERIAGAYFLAESNCFLHEALDTKRKAAPAEGPVRLEYVDHKAPCEPSNSCAIGDLYQMFQTHPQTVKRVARAGILLNGDIPHAALPAGAVSPGGPDCRSRPPRRLAYYLRLHNL